MKKLDSHEQIDKVRQRLYDRGSDIDAPKRHRLTEEPVEVSGSWDKGQSNGAANTTDLRQGMAGSGMEPSADGTYEAQYEAPKRKRHYRSFILIGSVIIFLLVAGLSSVFLYYGGNEISGDNIQVALMGETSIGGGELAQFQVAVKNVNSVPIESVTLILKYPKGTRSTGDPPRNLFEERVPVADIDPGETINVPIEVIIYGEEGEQKNIEATLEYRTQGSNGMFYKEIDPLELNISSSPLVLRIQSIKKVASGQLVDMTLTAVSNASTPINDILITADYPNGFSFEGSSPEPVYGQNVWRIDELLPEGTAMIQIQGIVSGLTEETFRINFEAGPANPVNPYLVGASLAETKVDLTIERPFIDIYLVIDNDDDLDVVIPEGDRASVEIDITNTLEETVYDMVVEVVPKGNALDEDSIVSNLGFYDSNTGSVRWEVANNASFDRVLPGDTRSLSFDIEQGKNRTTSSFDLTVNVYARRLAESSAQETLIGSVEAKAKYSSSVLVASQAGRSSGPFVDTGPIPPKVGEVTTYTLTLVAEAGANDVSNAVVETGLPLYVNWLDKYEANGTVTYNSVSKKLQWDVGNIDSGQRKELSFQVSIQPSISQVGDDPVILNSQKIRATDRFTDALLQDIAPAVTTKLSIEMGFGLRNGEVVQ